MSDDEFDNLPDEFADVPDVDWVHLLGGPSTTVSHTRPARDDLPGPSHQNQRDPPISPQSNDSSLYFPDDEMDSSFFAELDRVEQVITGGVPLAPPSNIANLPGRVGVYQNASSPQVNTASCNGETSSASVQMQMAPRPQSRGVSEPQGLHNLQNRAVHRLPLPNSNNASTRVEKDFKQTTLIPAKREHSADSSDVISPKRQGKMRASDELQDILSTYEEELTCPICFDLFVASHVGNPCGHTFCGDCGWQWLVDNRKKACPFCRMNLDESVPMIPNIAMDNTVERHVRALARSGVPEWEPGGSKFQAWDARKEAWSKGAAKRQKKRKRFQPQKAMPLVEVFDVPINWLEIPVADNEEEDPDYLDSDIELIPRPIQRARRRR